METWLIVGAAVFFFGILLTPITIRSGAPLPLLFLGLGMLLGENGPGGIDFDNFQLAYDLGSIALAIILFAGGLETDVSDIKKAGVPALVLATVGVCLTSAIVGGIIAFVFHIPLSIALLFGAVIGSTDAAATFMSLQQRAINLVGRCKETILLESGLNDPVAIFLTLALVSVVDNGTQTLGWSTVHILISQLGLGVLFGIAGGFILAWLANRVPLQFGLHSVFVLAGCLLLFGVTTSLEGSGFLAVFVGGIVINARMRASLHHVVNFHAGMAWLSQIGLFLMLGLLGNP